jgi:hypothetical protein
LIDAFGLRKQCKLAREQCAPVEDDSNEKQKERRSPLRSPYQIQNVPSVPWGNAYAYPEEGLTKR